MNVSFDTCACGKPGFRHERDATRYVVEKKRLTEPAEKVVCPAGDCWHVFNRTTQDKDAFLTYLRATAGQPPKTKAVENETTNGRSLSADTSSRTGTNCNKTGYGSEKLAKAALEYAQRARRDEKRAYQCKTCKRWHLTSLEQFYSADEITIEELLSFTQGGEAITVSAGRYPNGKIANVTLASSRGASLRIHAEHLTPLEVVLGSLGTSSGEDA